jgi:hypothetical protein
MIIFGHPVRISRRRAALYLDADTIGSAIVLILFMWFCISGIPMLLSDKPDAPRICVVDHCDATIISTHR